VSEFDGCDGVEARVGAHNEAFTAANAFVGVNDEGIAIGLRFDHGDGMISANGDAFLAVGTFVLINNVIAIGGLAGVDDDEGDQRKQKKDACNSFHD